MLEYKTHPALQRTLPHSFLQINITLESICWKTIRNIHWRLTWIHIPGIELGLTLWKWSQKTGLASMDPVRWSPKCSKVWWHQLTQHRSQTLELVVGLLLKLLLPPVPVTLLYFPLGPELLLAHSLFNLLPLHPIIWLVLWYLVKTC